MEKQPCVRCYKDINGSPRFWVIMVNGGDFHRESDPKPALDDKGYMGPQPVGSDCARQLRGEGVLVLKSGELDGW